MGSVCALVIWNSSGDYDAVTGIRPQLQFPGLKVIRCEKNVRDFAVFSAILSGVVTMLSWS